MTEKKVIRRKPVSEKRAASEALAPGDSLEYSISAEVRGPNGTAWVKAGVISVVRADETTADAQRRVVSYVEGTVAEKAAAIARGEV